VNHAYKLNCNNANYKSIKKESIVFAREPRSSYSTWIGSCGCGMGGHMIGMLISESIAQSGGKYPPLVCKGNKLIKS
jgi:hypothetical protein